MKTTSELEKSLTEWEIVEVNGYPNGYIKREGIPIQTITQTSEGFRRSDMVRGLYTNHRTYRTLTEALQDETAEETIDRLAALTDKRALEVNFKSDGMCVDMTKIDLLTSDEREEWHRAQMSLPTSGEMALAAKKRNQERFAQYRAEGKIK